MSQRPTPPTTDLIARLQAHIARAEDHAVKAPTTDMALLYDILAALTQNTPESDLARLARSPAPIGNGTTVGAQPVARFSPTPEELAKLIQELRAPIDPTGDLSGPVVAPLYSDLQLRAAEIIEHLSEELSTLRRQLAEADAVHAQDHYIATTLDWKLRPSIPHAERWRHEALARHASRTERTP